MDRITIGSDWLRRVAVGIAGSDHCAGRNYIEFWAGVKKFAAGEPNCSGASARDVIGPIAEADSHREERRLNPSAARQFPVRSTQ